MQYLGLSVPVSPVAPGRMGSKLIYVIITSPDF
jgi:hypothetical protein